MLQRREIKRRLCQVDAMRRIRKAIRRGARGIEARVVIRHRVRVGRLVVDDEISGTHRGLAHTSKQGANLSHIEVVEDSMAQDDLARCAPRGPREGTGRAACEVEEREAHVQ